VPGRALVGIGSALVATGMLAGCGGSPDRWDLPMSPLQRPVEIPLANRDICAELEADRLGPNCHVMAESGTADIVIVARFSGSLREYSGDVDGETIRWVGVSRFPAIQLADTSGTDGLASCRVALDVAPDQILLIIYRQQAADPKLAPCKPARDYAAKALAELQNPDR
jgi:hypothetical protein